MGSSDSSVVVASRSGTTRFWWMSNKLSGSAAALVTAGSNDDPSAVPLKLDNGCPADSVTSPWVTPDGKVIVLCGTTNYGQGHETSFAQITAVSQTNLRSAPPGTTPPFILAYNDSFHLAAFLLFAMIPRIFLCTKTSGSSTAGAH